MIRPYGPRRPGLPDPRRRQAPGGDPRHDPRHRRASAYIWLPTPYVFTAWWPWVKNYDGELRAGAVRSGPIYARAWIDQEMKKKLGF
jgi:hypothetical protein